MVAFDPSASSFTGRPVSPPAVHPASAKIIDLTHAHEFWHHRWVQNVLPFATSLIVHLAILAVGIALYQAVTEVKVIPHEQVTIPQSAMIAKDDLPMAIPQPTPIELLDTKANLPQIEDPLNQLKILPKGMSAFDGGPGHDDPMLVHNTTPSFRAGPGNGIGEGRGQAPFELPKSGGMPMTHLLPGDPGGTGKKIVYLCDASGSMLGVFGSLKQKMKTSVNELALESGQEFNVIFFSDDNCFPLFKDGTRLATEDNKKLAFDFIDNAVSTGGTQPLPAIRFAMAEKPDLLFVLTDGFDQIAHFDDVVNAFRDGNKDRKMQINCIFLESDSDPQLEKVLRQIADDGHGKYTKVRKEDM